METSPPRPARQWTAAQRQAIETINSSLLVSAAAGSGKTSVLAERCVHLLCDADPPCEVSDLLVVTFTEAAAAEMKARIARSLADRHRQSPTQATAKHLAMLDRASISTLHSFCARVLRQNFHLMGLDPEFRILDADESALMKLDVARDLFDERYDDEHGEDFRRTIDCYAEGQDDRLIKQVIRAYDTLCSVVDPAGWLHQARHRVEQAIDLPIEKSELGQAYIRIIRAELNSILRECAAAANSIKQLRRFEMYVAHLRELWTVLKHWQSMLDSHGLDVLAEESTSVELPALPRVSGSIEGKELAKGLVDSVRDAMKKGVWRKNLLFTTEQWKQGLSLTLPHVDVFLSLVADFSEKYSHAKDEEGLVDFADLELLTLRSLKTEGVDPIKPSPLARYFHQQFQHVLVDEYQDINQVQDAILSLVSRECLAGDGNQPGNLFCVGDVKQSIYRFRLAEAAQFLHRRALYSEPRSHAKVIDLQTNFRSRAPLLEAVNGVFSRLMTQEAADLDYDDSQKLTPGQSFPEIENGFTGSPIELRLLPRDGPAEAEDDEANLDRTQREAVVLGHRILEMVRHPMRVADRSSSDAESRPIRFGDIVILLRSMRFKADQFAATLRQMGVPVHAESVTGYFEATEINDVLSLLHVLDNQRQDIHLAALLRSPLIQLQNPESSLAKIRIAYPGDVPFYLAVQKYADEQKDELSIFLRDFRGKLERWRQEIRQRPVAEMLWSLYDQTGYLAYVAGLPNGQQRQANLIELHDRARQFGTFQRQGLGRFLTFLEKLKAQTDLGQASTASEAGDVVRIMSIHRSKGQEFAVVLIPDLGKAINLSDSHGTILLDRSAGLGLSVIDDVQQIRYPSLASTVVQHRLKQQAMAEELRVLYVAMTRAKEHLILAGTITDKQIEKWKQWAGHKGPIPAETVLAARSPVDWLGPVTAANPDQFDVHAHTLEELSEWMADQPAINELSPTQLQMAHLQPLTPPPPMTAHAMEIVTGLSREYAHRSTMDRAAAVSVTSLVKTTGAGAVETVGLPSNSVDRVLGRPLFLADDLPPDAADIGTATHAVLEHFDFSYPGEADVHGEVQRQIDRLVQSRRLTSPLADIVDREAIAWFLGSEVGRQIRENAGALHRELPVYYVNPADEQEDPFDLQMIRGRIDLMLPFERGWMIVDYKTDRVEGPALDERAVVYAAQLNQYSQAIEKITGRPVIRSAVVFLNPREIRIVGAATASGE